MSSCDELIAGSTELAEKKREKLLDSNCIWRHLRVGGVAHETAESPALQLLRPHPRQKKARMAHPPSTDNTDLNASNPKIKSPVRAPGFH